MSTSLTDAVVLEQTVERSDQPFDLGLILAGLAIIGVFLTGSVVWSLLAPIESAVVAPGVISVDSSRKTVQHLEGGIVDQILIREGSRVRAGEVIIRLRDTLRVAARNQIQAQYFEARAAEVRLIAERDSKAEIQWPEDLRDAATSTDLRSALVGQESIFMSRRSLLVERTGVLQQKIAGLKEKIEGNRKKINASRKQLALVDEELDGITSLYAKGLVPKPRMLSLEARKAEIESALSELNASIARAEEAIGETRLRIAELNAASVNEISEQLRATTARAYELAQGLAAAEDILRRVEIRSPTDGVVVGLKAHTVGGVIAAGEPILEIVPSQDDLVVQASIAPEDIDQVHVGLPADVRLTAFNRRAGPPIEGEVKMVSADRLVDAQTGLPYYVARIELRANAPGLKTTPLQAGMGAEVMIKATARTPLEYLLEPIRRSFGRALREE